jgi:hypothetical protein
MNTKIQRNRIVIKDSVKKHVRDRFGSFGAPGVNKVTIHSRDVNTGQVKLEEETHNLIVYHGRSWMMQRAFGLNLGALGDQTYPYPWYHNDDAEPIALQRLNWHQMYINWFAVGQGGSVSGSPLTPEAVKSSEYELIDHVPIGYLNVNPVGTTANLRYTHPASFGRGARERDYHAMDATYPQFLVDPDIVPGLGGTVDPDYDSLEVSDHLTGEILYGGYKADSYLRALVRVTLQPEECNGNSFYDPSLGGNTYRDLSEAGLFVSPSHIPTGVGGIDHLSTQNQVEMLAKVNFSGIRKDDTRELVVTWYLYF